jgi:hypothetical protein
MFKKVPEKYLTEIGKKYYQIIIQGFEILKGNLYTIYKCECGNVSKCQYKKLSKKCKICSLKIASEFLKMRTKHGARKKSSKNNKRISSSEYSTWKNMKTRCNNYKNKDYYKYGGKGIKIYEKWLGKDGFINFLNDMGEKPLPKEIYSIDRINNNLGYFPENCKWSTTQEQTNNRNIYPITKQCLICQTEYTTHSDRLNTGKYCSKRCNKKAFYNKNKRDISIPIQCSTCKKEFTSKRKQLYCSKTCCFKAYKTRISLKTI